MIEYDTEQVKLVWPKTFKESMTAKATELGIDLKTLITNAVTDKYMGDYLKFYIKKKGIVAESNELVLEEMTDEDYKELESRRIQKWQS